MIVQTKFLIPAILSIGLIFNSCANKQDEMIDEEMSQEVPATENSNQPVVHNHYNTTTTTNQAPERKKMSNTAKGALIGAGAGAITGAAVSKKKGQGAIVGGVIGAGAGAIAGKVIDKKKENDDQ